MMQINILWTDLTLKHNLWTQITILSKMQTHISMYSSESPRNYYIKECTKTITIHKYIEQRYTADTQPINNTNCFSFGEKMT